jgi:hypothetical protein
MRLRRFLITEPMAGVLTFFSSVSRTQVAYAYLAASNPSAQLLRTEPSIPKLALGPRLPKLDATDEALEAPGTSVDVTRPRRNLTLPGWTLFHETGSARCTADDSRAVQPASKYEVSR